MRILTQAAQTHQLVDEIAAVVRENADVDHAVLDAVGTFFPGKGHAQAVFGVVDLHQQHHKATHQSAVVLAHHGSALLVDPQGVFFALGQLRDGSFAKTEGAFRAFR